MTTTPQDVQAAGLLAAIEQAKREMAEERERLERAAEALAVRQSQPVQDDSLSAMLREFHHSHAKDAPKTRMDNPCEFVKDGVKCGLPWRDDMGTITHPRTHSYRPVPMPPAPEPGKYALTSSERAQAGLTEPPTAQPGDMYVSEKQASTLLSVPVKDVRKLVKDGAIAVTAVGDVKLLHRASVLRIVAAKEIAELAGAEDDE